MKNYWKALSKGTGKLRALSVIIAVSFVLLTSKACGVPKEDVSSSVSESVDKKNEVSSVSKDETKTSNDKTDSDKPTETQKEEEPEMKAEMNNGIVEVVTKEHEIPDGEALEFVRGLGAGWNLGNTFDAQDSNGNYRSDLEYETYWQSNYTNKQNILDLKEAGFSTIRIPVSWHNHVDENFTISPAWLARVKEVVDYAYEEGMYVIINIHHDNERAFMYPSYGTIDNSEKYVAAIWKQVAECFGDYDEHLIMECLNEPRQKDTGNEWWIDTNSDIGKEAIDCVNRLNQIAVDTIRQAPGEYNTERYIMCPGYCASPEFVLCDGFKLPDDSYATKENRLLISVHSYTPYKFALDDNQSTSTDKFSMSKNSDTADIQSFMERVYSKYISNGTGVVIGEFGSRKRGENVDARVEHAAYYVAMARSYGMSAVWWDNNNNSGSGEEFTIYNRVNNDFLYPDIVNQLVYYGNR